jgi:hypothetical protein
MRGYTAANFIKSLPFERLNIHDYDIIIIIIIILYTYRQKQYQ